MAQTCPACGHQWGGRREEQRIDRKAALAAYDKLREVQQEILFTLYRLDILSQQTIGDTFFQATESKKRNETAGKNLVVLERAGLVVRHDAEAKYHFKVFYSLSPEGMYACTNVEKQGRPIRKVRESKAKALKSSIHFQHHLYLADVVCSFIAEERKGHGELLDFQGDGEVCYVFPFLGSRRRLQPDSTVLWTNGEEPYLFFLELENRHSTLRDAEEKVKKYVFMSAAGYNTGDYFRKTLGQTEFPPLLIVGVRRNQLIGLRRSIINGVLQAHAGMLPDVSRRVVIALAALDDIKAQGVLGTCWECPLQAKACGFEALFRLN